MGTYLTPSAGEKGGSVGGAVARAIGIDLGTTNSCVSVLEGGRPAIFENDTGRRTTPSVVSFKENGEILVGESAKKELLLDPENTVFASKRLMGRKYSEKAVQDFSKMVPYKIVRHENGDAWIEVRGKRYSPSQISGTVLSVMKEAAEKKLGEKVTKAVVTVPAYFNDAQRQATRDAGKIAGLDVLRIVNEPTAASLAYGLEGGKNGTVVVYDLGGGTFDVSVLELCDGVFEVKATNGDTGLGGEDFDRRLMQHLEARVKRECGVDVSKDITAKERVREAAEKAKKDLSTAFETEVVLPFIGASSNKPAHFRGKLTRREFEGMTADLVEKTIGPCLQALEDAKIEKKDIDAVVLVGGMTRVPFVVNTVKRLFGKAPYQGMNPDEVVALGAGIQAGVVSGEKKEILLLDVNPLSLGVETLGGVFSRIVDRNTTLPVKKTQTFTTAVDGQSEVHVKAYQGERHLVEGNKLLGEFTLSGFAAAAKGVPKIEITFEIDANGIVNVSAKDLATNKDASIMIEAPSGLGKGEIERMVEESEKNREADRKKGKLSEARNKAEIAITEARRAAGETGKSTAKIESLCAELAGKIEEESIESIKGKTDELKAEIKRLF
ncbi:MAG: mitochondrial-type heat shock protein 70 [Amphiamblys sp. WSBS2006]|nr:MAG: mitochondrial-type heat shock protein 70 [Amphiamblys sp. WSBS2006]